MMRFKGTDALMTGSNWFDSQTILDGIRRGRVFLSSGPILSFQAHGSDGVDVVLPGDPTKVLRPAEVEHLLGDASKARAELGWTPKVGFKQLVEMMVDADLERLTSASAGVTRVPAR